MKIIGYLLIFVSVTGLIFSSSSCKKTDPINRTVYQDTLIAGNTPPPYEGVPTIKIENYVNRYHIDLLGREPSTGELDQAVQYLKDNDISMAARDTLIQKLFSTTAYYIRFNEIVSGKLIQGIDTSNIDEQIATLEYIRDTLYAPGGDSLEVHAIEIELDKLYKLRSARTDYQSGSISINELYKRYIYNGFYDEINMGSENFVKGTFENLFHRFPTQSELNRGIAMVEGNSTAIFLKDGNSKLDFVRISTQTTAFYEGLVKTAFQSLLVREPASLEMAENTDTLSMPGYGYEYIQKKILKSTEYAGF